MYREMKDSDKEKESGKMVRILHLCTFLWLFKHKKKSYCGFWNATLKKTNSFQLLKGYERVYL